MSTTIADQSLRAHANGKFEKARLSAARPELPVKKILTIFAVWCAMIVAGCDRYSAQHDFNSAPSKLKAARIRVTARPHQHSEPSRCPELQIRELDPALLTPQPAPDCEYKRSDLKTVDPDEWARLRTEYELKCYRDAEEVARVRLGLLQASSSTCRIEAVLQRLSLPKKGDHAAATCLRGCD